MKDNCKCFERSLRNTIQNNENVWIFLFLCSYSSRKMSLNSKVKSKVAGKRCRNADIPCGSGAALAWDDAKARPVGMHEGLGSNVVCPGSFGASSILFSNGDWTLMKSTNLLLPVRSSQPFLSVQIAKCCICPADCQTKIFGVQFIGPRRLIKIALVPKN